jgi:hypothetical protein
MCTNSVECKTVITVILMVICGMVHFGLDFLKWVSLGCASATVRLYDVIEIVTLRC